MPILTNQNSAGRINTIEKGGRMKKISVLLLIILMQSNVFAGSVAIYSTGPIFPVAGSSYSWLWGVEGNNLGIEPKLGGKLCLKRERA